MEDNFHFNQTENSSIDYYMKNIMFTSKFVTGVIGTLTVFLNGISGLAILKCKSINKRIKICYSGFILSGISIGCIALQVTFVPVEIVMTSAFCSYRVGIGIMIILTMSFVVVLVTLERFITIRLSFYCHLITWEKLCVAMVCITFISCTIILSFYLSTGFGGKYTCDYITCGTKHLCRLVAIVFILATIAIFTMYFSIMKDIQRHLKQIAATAVFTGLAIPRGGNRPRSKMATVTMAIILFAFAFCYLPIAILFFYISVTDEKNLIPYNQPLRSVTVTMLSVNSLFNPIIYFWRIKSCRNEIQKMFSKSQPKSTIVVTSTSHRIQPILP